MMQDQTFCKNVKVQSLSKKRFKKGVKSGLIVKQICSWKEFADLGYMYHLEGTNVGLK